LPTGEAVLDGEVVTEGADGVPSFSALLNALAARRTGRLIFYCFDLLYLGGRDLRLLPLIERKTKLAEIVAGRTERVRYVEHFEGDGAIVLRHACRLGLRQDGRAARAVLSAIGVSPT
jgi:bifunctional non-homologous end joining protein LigD